MAKAPFIEVENENASGMEYLSINFSKLTTEESADSNQPEHNEEIKKLVKRRGAGIPVFFIRDLLRVKKFSDRQITKYDYYTIKGLIFKNVKIRGIIAGIERNVRRPRYYVDDGTAAIRCIFQDQTCLANARKNTKECIEEAKTFDQSKLQIKAALMLLNKNKKHLEEFPPPEEFEVGQTVVTTLVAVALARPEPPSGYSYSAPSAPSGSYGAPAPKYGPPAQIPTVHKHVYVHVPPPEPEYIAPHRHIEVAAPQKHYKIIFIKAPTAPTPTAPVIPLQPQNEEKTLVYVLVKKPEEAPEIHIPTPAPTQPSKPEVYFIRYKTQKEEGYPDSGVPNNQYGPPASQPSSQYGAP